VPAVLLVYRVRSPFLLADRDILRRHFDVEEFCWPEHARPARELVRWMRRNRRSYDLVFSWFGNTHASIATSMAWLQRKPSIIQVGGYDVSDIPHYGFLATRNGMMWARLHFRLASRVLAVSRDLESKLHAQFPRTHGRTIILPTGVDVQRFRPQGPKVRRVLSVAPAGDWPRASVKGWDRIAAVARRLPEVPFRLFGAGSGIAEMLQPPRNLEVLGPVPQDDLVPEYREAAVYLQASRSEGMPNAVMEAMASGCVPVVTGVGGMPDLVGDAGFVVAGRPEALAAGVSQAFENVPLGEKARNRVVELYSLARREAGLVAVIEELLHR